MIQIKSLDDHDNADVEELWLQEAERRYREYREGKLQTRPADNVFRDVFSRIIRNTGDRCRIVSCSDLSRLIRSMWLRPLMKLLF